MQKRSLDYYCIALIPDNSIPTMITVDSGIFSREPKQGESNRIQRPIAVKNL
jgi:hypothetical protein